MGADAYPCLIQSLRDHLGGAAICETHISWVLLTERDAYKIKKPVNFGFLDFSQLEQRRFYCHEELRLNRRLAPDLYLDVLPISGPPESAQFGGTEASAIDYAVHMRRFDRAAEGARLADAGALEAADIDAMAALLADFHAHLPAVSSAEPWGHATNFYAASDECLQHLRAAPNMDSAQLARLDAWSQARRSALTPVLEQRRAHGWVRECHGDLHLGNWVRQHGTWLVFDGIEFNPSLRWIDVLNDLAFLAMDLHAHGLAGLAWRLLNRVLEHSGDYAGLAVWADYGVYRALVRAKVADLSHDARRAADYLNLAERLSQPPVHGLLITHGLSGSGKTWVSAQLIERLGAVRLRSDVERKRLFDLSAQQRGGADLYTAEATRRTYQHLLTQAEAVLKAGYSVIVDAAFLSAAQRAEFADCAAALNQAFWIIDVQAAPDCLAERLIKRGEQDASDATPAVLAMQQRNADTLSVNERAHCLPIRTDRVAVLAEDLSASVARVQAASQS